MPPTRKRMPKIPSRSIEDFANPRCTFEEGKDEQTIKTNRTLTIKYWIKYIACRQLILKESDLKYIGMKWRLSDAEVNELRTNYAQYKKSIITRMDQLVDRWLDQTPGYRGLVKLTQQQVDRILPDDDTVRRIFAPIATVLSDDPWKRNADDERSPWLSVFYSRAANYVSYTAKAKRKDKPMSTDLVTKCLGHTDEKARGLKHLKRNFTHDHPSLFQPLKDTYSNVLVPTVVHNIMLIWLEDMTHIPLI